MNPLSARTQRGPGTLLGAAVLALAWLLVPPRPEAVAQPREASAEAVPTRVMVRVVAQGAKVLGDGVGGARVTIRDLATGEVLARGVQRGGTGSTDRIMREPHLQKDTIYATPGTAGYEATLQLAEPTPVEIVGEGPLDYPEAARQATATMLLVPGRHVLGDGVVLTLHGFLVELLEPGASTSAPDDSLRVQAEVTLMCGCPTTPGGLWDSDAIDVTARIMQPGGTVVAEAPLYYAGTRSTYAGTLPRPAADLQGAEVQVVAADAAGANFGLGRRPLSSPAARE